MWRSDGTAAGTVLIRRTPMSVFTLGSPQFTAVGATVFFVGYVPGYGVELLKSDGTPQGTVMVKDIYRGPDGSDPRWLTEFQGRLLFRAFGKERPRRTTSRGSRTEPSREPRLSSTSSSSPPSCSRASDHVWPTLAHRARTPSGFGGRMALQQGTEQVAPFKRGPYNAVAVFDLTVSNGELLFFANDGTYGMELWKVFPATAQPIGHPCTATGAGPRLAATDPAFNSTMRIHGERFDRPTNVWVLASLHATPQVLGPCMLYLDPGTADILHAAPLTSSSWSASFPVPLMSSLTGVSFALQALHAPTASPFGGDLTNGVVLTFGN